MKIVSNLKRTKADQETKATNLLGANHRRVRHSGGVYFISVAKVGGMILASAHLGGTKDEINLFGKDKLAQELRKLCENRLYT